MKLNRPSLLVVKYYSSKAKDNNNSVFVEYRVNKGRSIALLMSYFRAIDNFRMAWLYDYEGKVRGKQTLYFDKKTYEL